MCCLGPDCGLIAARGNAIGRTEVPIEMALVGKTQVMGNLGGAQATAQQALCAAGAQLHGPLAGAQAGFFLEGAQDVEFGQAQLTNRPSVVEP